MSSRTPRFSSHDALLDSKPSATLDLHGFPAAEGRSAIVAFVKRHRSGDLLHIITGKGKGSASKPVLRSMVSGMLKGELNSLVADWTLDAGDGGYRIRIR